MREGSIPSKKAGATWMLQAITGLLLVGLLGLHLAANHFVAPGGLQTYQEVVRYLSNPVILVFEVMFLFVVTVHALLGVRAIILDSGLSNSREKSLNRILTGLGVIIVLYGLGLTFVMIRR